MPQIKVIIDQRGLANMFLQEPCVDDLAKHLTKAVEEAFGIRGKNDVAFDVFPVLYTKGETPVQIEVVYTAGEDEYGTGKPFDPTEGERKTAIHDILVAFKEFLREYTIIDDIITPSVWIIPQYNSTFKAGKV